MLRKKLKYQVGGIPNFGFNVKPQRNVADNTRVSKLPIIPISMGTKPLPEYLNNKTTGVLKQISLLNNERFTDREKDVLSNNSNPNENSPIVENFPFDSLQYLTNRQLLSENGNPNINYNIDSSNVDTSNFTPDNNSINLHLASSLIPEISHSQQLKHYGLHTMDSRFDKDSLNAPYTNQTEYDAKQYSTPGTIEYEAHKVIEPKLNDRWNTIIDSIQNRKKTGKQWYQAGGKI